MSPRLPLQIALAFAPIAAFAFAVPACSLFSSGGKCDLRASNVATGYCWDVEDTSIPGVNTTYEVLCRGLGANWENGSCDRESSIGGCRKEGQAGVETRWFYPDGEYKTFEDLAAAGCKSGEVVVDKDGMTRNVDLAGVDQARTLPGPAPTVCSRQSATSINITFVNGTARPLRLFWVDYQCGELDYGEIAAGASKPSQTFTTHPWRLRDASTLELVKDVPPFDTAGSYTVTVP